MSDNHSDDKAAHGTPAPDIRRWEFLKTVSATAGVVQLARAIVS